MVTIKNAFLSVEVDAVSKEGRRAQSSPQTKRFTT